TADELGAAKSRSAVIVRMVNAIARAIPTVNTNLAGFGFGVMYPSWRQIDVAMADFRGAKRKRCVSYFTLRWCPKNARWPKTLWELARVWAMLRREKSALLAGCWKGGAGLRG